MKRILSIILILGLIICFASCSTNNDNNNNNNTPSTTETESKVETEKTGSLKKANFKYEEAEKIDKNKIISDGGASIIEFSRVDNEKNDPNVEKIILKGKFNKSLKSFMSTDPFIHTNLLFDVIEVIQGNYEYDQIIVDSIGGTVSLYEYSRVVKTSGKTNFEEKYTEQELKELYIRDYPSMSEQFDLMSQDDSPEYIIFVSHYIKEDYYRVGLTKISVLPIKNNKITLPIEDETIDVNDLKNFGK